MLALLVVHLVAALAAPALIGKMGRRGFYVLALAPASAAVWALAWGPRVADGTVPTEELTWIGDLGLDLAFRLDTLSWFMTVIVGGVGALVLAYCASYFSKDAQGLGRFGAVFVAFAGAMLGLVTADDLIALFVFWELTTVTSYLLIGHYSDRKTSRRAAMEAIVVTTAGGLAMLVGLVLLGVEAGTWRLSELIANPPEASTLVVTAVVLVLVGALTKSALIPFHFWLPAAMAAPTPVSAYLHAAAMVKAGVYLVARFAPAFSDLAAWRWVVLVAGAGTLLLGGYRALRQHDLKLVLAFGTVSQLGLLILLVGYGTRATALAGLAMLGAHAMFKASLFLVVGVVDAATGTRDLRRLSGVGRELPWTAAAGALAVASMIGLPPLAGYVAKEAALASLMHAEDSTGTLVLVVVGIGSVLTVAYGLRFWWGAFSTKPAVLAPEAITTNDGAATATPITAAVPGVEPATVRHPSGLLTVPAGLLALLGLVLALWPATGDRILGPHAATYPVGAPGHLTLWDGFLGAAITAAILGLGATLFAVRDRVERAQAAVAHTVSVDRAYRRGMRRLDDVATDVTAAVQRGSLPVYLGLILTVFIVAVGSLLLTSTTLPTQVRAYDNLAQVALGAAVVIATVLVARSRRRLKGAILLGVVGYAVAGLFLLQGAPDLALTQVLVETITVFVLVLVMRRLSPYFSVRPLAASRWLRLAIAVGVGLVVGGVALVAPAARVAEPVSTGFAEAAYEGGGGKNIVNVTLVDIRAWDTVGEISVLLVAATGVASLVFVSRRTGRIFRTKDAAADRAVWGGADDPHASLRGPLHDENAGAATARNQEWLRAVRTLAPRRRSVVFEVVARLLFHTMIVYSLYLMFSGHNSPGGGFAAGLVTGIALVVRYLAGGRYELGEAAPVQPGTVLGAGLFVAAGTGVAAMFFGASVFTSAILEVTLPVLGHVKLVTSLFFDVGVYLVVVGLMLDILRTLGAELDRRAESGEDPQFEQVGAAR
ncbi:MAG: Na+/H+ antiporter subunit A [Micrococcales bacterium]|nr:Na+/H+ antiporter subunit A [Micrococcales bacterium]